MTDAGHTRGGTSLLGVSADAPRTPQRPSSALPGSRRPATRRDSALGTPSPTRAHQLGSTSSLALSSGSQASRQRSRSREAHAAAAAVPGAAALSLGREAFERRSAGATSPGAFERRFLPSGFASASASPDRQSQAHRRPVSAAHASSRQYRDDSVSRKTEGSARLTSITHLAELDAAGAAAVVDPSPALLISPFDAPSLALPPPSLDDVSQRRALTRLASQAPALSRGKAFARGPSLRGRWVVRPIPPALAVAWPGLAAEEFAASGASQLLSGLLAEREAWTSALKAARRGSASGARGRAALEWAADVSAWQRRRRSHGLRAAGPRPPAPPALALHWRGPAPPVDVRRLPVPVCEECYLGLTALADRCLGGESAVDVLALTARSRGFLGRSAEPGQRADNGGRSSAAGSWGAGHSSRQRRRRATSASTTTTTTATETVRGAGRSGCHSSSRIPPSPSPLSRSSAGPSASGLEAGRDRARAFSGSLARGRPASAMPRTGGDVCVAGASGNNHQPVTGRPASAAHFHRAAGSAWGEMAGSSHAHQDGMRFGSVEPESLARDDVSDSDEEHGRVVRGTTSGALETATATVEAAVRGPASDGVQSATGSTSWEEVDHHQQAAMRAEPPAEQRCEGRIPDRWPDTFIQQPQRQAGRAARRSASSSSPSAAAGGAGVAASHPAPPPGSAAAMASEIRSQIAERDTAADTAWYGPSSPAQRARLAAKATGHFRTDPRTDSARYATDTNWMQLEDETALFRGSTGTSAASPVALPPSGSAESLEAHAGCPARQGAEARRPGRAEGAAGGSAVGRDAYDASARAVSLPASPPSSPTTPADGGVACRRRRPGSASSSARPTSRLSSSKGHNGGGGGRGCGDGFMPEAAPATVADRLATVYKARGVPRSLYSPPPPDPFARRPQSGSTALVASVLAKAGLVRSSDARMRAQAEQDTRRQSMQSQAGIMGASRGRGPRVSSASAAPGWSAAGSKPALPGGDHDVGERLAAAAAAAASTLQLPDVNERHRGPGWGSSGRLQSNSITTRGANPSSETDLRATELRSGFPLGSLSSAPAGYMGHMALLAEQQPAARESAIRSSSSVALHGRASRVDSGDAFSHEYNSNRQEVPPGKSLLPQGPAGASSVPAAGRAVAASARRPSLEGRRRPDFDSRTGLSAQAGSDAARRSLAQAQQDAFRRDQALIRRQRLERRGSRPASAKISAGAYARLSGRSRRRSSAADPGAASARQMTEADAGGLMAARPV